jgi:transposase
MQTKRPFSEETFQSLPEPVQQYIVQLEETVVRLHREVESLNKRVSELESRINQNSQNTSKPPSSDSPYNKPDKKNRKKGQRKRGGQKGHKGHQQKLMEPTVETPLFPETCSCGCNEFDPKSIQPYYTHQVIELPEIQMDVQHFILHKGVCEQCGEMVKAYLPEDKLTGYGPRLSALVAEVSGIQGNSRETVRRFCQSVLGFSISSGAIQKIVDRSSQALKPAYDLIGNIARNCDVNYIDETSWSQQGVLNWLWVMANRSVAYFMIHKNRSKEAFLALVKDWDGILVSDNYGVYQKWANLRQSCLAHLIRKATALSENTDEKISDFGQKIKQDLQLLCHWAKSHPNHQEWRDFYERFIGLIFEHQNDKDDVGTMARSLIRQVESLWLFLDVVEVDPTNNHAEQTLRYGVLWRKRSKGTQSSKGNQWVERILSFKHTCSIRRLNSFPILVDLMNSYFKKQEPDLSWL